MSETEREVRPKMLGLSVGTAAGAAGPTAGTERALLEILTDVVGVEQASVDSHFFNALGADSMVMARFCARVRKRPDLPIVTIKDVYAHPTVRRLAEALGEPSPDPLVTAVPREEPAPEPAARRRAGTPMYVLCGVIQLLFFAVYLAVTEVAAVVGDQWISAAADVSELFLRAAVYGDTALLAMCILPIAAKWVLIGRWTTQQFPVWSLAYIRFWLVKTLVRANPLLLLVGGRSRSNTTSPIITIYLRALGANIGPGVTIYTRILPVCTDLLTIGAGTVIRNEAMITCYRAHDGQIQTGPVHLGEDVFVGEAAVIDIGASIGDRAQLGHVSSLHTGQTVPAGESWHGCPAQPTNVNYRIIGQVAGARRRAVFFGATQLLNTFVVTVPLSVAVLALACEDFPQLDRLLSPEPGALTTGSFYRDVSIISAVVVGTTLILGLPAVGTIPRLLNRMIKPDTVYPLYGFHYGIHATIARLTNSQFMGSLFGDSSYIVHYLRWIGYDLSTVVQTGSNFGAAVRHESPYLVTIGSGTMVADGLAILNADFSNSAFRLSRARIGADSFLGNSIYYPAQSRVGDNCLLASKAMVPIDGRTREGTGLLGSPTFPIPRTVARDKAQRLGRAEQRHRLRAKNRHNIVTMAFFLLLRWCFLLSVLVLTGAFSEAYEEWNPLAALVLSGLVYPLWMILVWALTERLVTPRFRRLRPQHCSIYDPYFRKHERYWKVNWQDYYALFNGTPFKNVLWRLAGVRIGRRFFDDGLSMTERSLVTIGDDCTANQTSVIQGHSQEDGAFKSDYITIGSRVTLGAGVWINYGATVGDDVTIEPHSYVMKGEEISPGARWSGNPAAEVRADRDVAHPVRQVPEGAARV
ncbi:Pls/PosA family non-ribosomal peptide synthetase [Pseudonocardia sp. CA-142604]|uniref:Pls/PosA family non-ribosomal peptide synthetase n=1 Tax=Pseudonocardia sp. CA-142604 TaxID=3240024 RepID=UPI003D8D1C03